MKKTILILLCFVAVLAALFGLSVLRDCFLPKAETPAVAEEELPVDWDNALDEAHATMIVLDGDSIRTQGLGAAVQGTTVTIRYPGTYILSGGLHDGQVIVDCEHDGTVYLELNSVQIHCYTGPGIFVKQAKDTVLVLPEGSQSYISDGDTYATVYAADGTEDPDQPDAAVFSRDDLHIEGSGILDIIGSYHDAIHCKDDLKFMGGVVNLTSVNDGAKGTESITVEGGTLNILSGADGLQSTKGPIEVTGGELNILSAGDGLAALTAVSVSGGCIGVTAAEGYDRYEDIVVTDTSAKGLKADNIVIAGGEVTLNTADDALHAESGLTVCGGHCLLYSGDDALSASSIHIQGGEVTVEESYEGIEGLQILLSGGAVKVHADNNGLASTLGILDEGLTAADCSVTVTGGTLEVTAPQALKTDGSFLLEDGAVFLHGQSLDDDAVEILSGGLMRGGMAVICGALNAAEPLTVEAGFDYVLHRLASPAAGGTAIEIKNEAGQTCFRYTPEDSFDAFFVAYNGLVDGGSYQIAVGDEIAVVELAEETALAPAGMSASGPMGTGF